MRKKKNSFCIYISIIFSFLAILIIHSIAWVQAEWSNIDFATIIFQLHTPLQGTNSEIIYDYLKECLVKSVYETAIIQIVFAFGMNIFSKLDIFLEIRLIFKKLRFVLNLKTFKRVFYLFYGILFVITVWKMNQISFLKVAMKVRRRIKVVNRPIGRGG